MFVTYRHTNIQTNIHTYIQTLWLLESLDLLDRETNNGMRTGVRQCLQVSERDREGSEVKWVMAG